MPNHKLWGQASLVEGRAGGDVVCVGETWGQANRDKVAAQRMMLGNIPCPSGNI